MLKALLIPEWLNLHSFKIWSAISIFAFGIYKCFLHNAVIFFQSLEQNALFCKVERVAKI